MLRTDSVKIRSDLRAGALVAVFSVCLALAPAVRLKAFILIVGLLGTFLFWLSGRRDRWLTAFFVCAILAPPFPIALGNSGPHIAPVFAFFGILCTIALARHVRPEHGRLLHFNALFLCALLISAGFSAFYSSPDVALLSVFRIVLFAISPFVLFYAVTVQRPDTTRVKSFTSLLFRLAVIAALFACVDFRLQLPSPAGFGPQFVWLENEVLRRAQGLFYEASTLGNFCAFFLVYALAAFFAPSSVRPNSRPELAIGAVVLGSALIVSYSRASLLNLVCAIVTFVLIAKQVSKKAIAIAVLSPVAVALLVAFSMPEFWHSYWVRVQTSLVYFHAEPEAVLSGRLSSWHALSEFAIAHPLELVLGIGYKTLPYSTHVGQNVIADNTYLSLLIETGIIGLLAFLAVNYELLKLSLRASGQQHDLSGLLGRCFFCFWIGEIIQMASGDLITYWRVLPIYFWVLGAAINLQAEARTRFSLSPSLAQ